MQLAVNSIFGEWMTTGNFSEFCRSRILQHGGVWGSMSAEWGDSDGVSDVRADEGWPVCRQGVRADRLWLQRHGYRRRKMLRASQLPHPASRSRHARRQRLSCPGVVTPWSSLLVPTRWAYPGRRLQTQNYQGIFFRVSRQLVLFSKS